MNSHPSGSGGPVLSLGLLAASQFPIVALAHADPTAPLIIVRRVIMLTNPFIQYAGAHTPCLNAPIVGSKPYVSQTSHADSMSPIIASMHPRSRTTSLCLLPGDWSVGLMGADVLC